MKMPQETIDAVLELVKTDIGITHNKSDEYFSLAIPAAESDLARKGIDIDAEDTGDIFLLKDYVCWMYRNRIRGEPVPNSLVFRIRDRIIRARSERDE